MLMAPATDATSRDAGVPMSSLRAAKLPAATPGRPRARRCADTTRARRTL
jgi:hypothetical protein